MLCSEPFSVAYGLDMLDDVLVIDIGAGTTDLCRMHGTMPEESDQITNTFAGDYVDNQLAELIQKKLPRGAVHDPDGQGDQGALLLGRRRRWSRRSSTCRSTASRRSSTSPSELRARLPRRSSRPIVEGLGELIATFDPEFQDRLKNRVLLAGGGSQIKGLDIGHRARDARAPRRRQGHAHRGADLRRRERRAQDRARHAGGVLGEAEVADG